MKHCCLFLTLVLMVGCQHDSYVVVSHTQKPNDEGQMLDKFVIEHNGVSMNASCLPYYVDSDGKPNHCHDLRVGEKYEFKRDGDFLTLGTYGKEDWIAVGVLDEHVK